MNRALVNGRVIFMTEKFKKQQDSTPIESIQWGSSWPEFAKKSDRKRLFGYLEDRFGISSEYFDNCLLFGNDKSWWIIYDSPEIRQIAHIKQVRAGIKAFQKIGEFVKPSTRMIQQFGYLASRALFEIDQTDLEALLKKEEIVCNLELDNGYVILRLKGKIMGLGLLINGLIRSQLPGKEIRL